MQISELFGLIKNNKFKEAIIGLNKFLVESPKDIDGLNLLGVAYNHVGDFVNAQKIFEKAVTHHSNHFQSRLNLALCHVKLNELKLAKDQLNICINLQKNQPDALNALGNIYRIEGNNKDSEALLKKAYSLAPKNPAIYENLAWLAINKGDINQAEHQFLQLNQAFPTNLSVVLGLAECQLKRGKLIKAEQSLQSIIKRQPNHSEAHLLLSSLLSKQQEYKKRVYHLQQAIKYSPQLVEGHFQLALAYQETGSEHQSTEHFERVIQIKPSYFEAYFHLAYKANYKFPESQLIKLHKLVDKYQQNPELYWLNFALAKIEEKRGDYQQASFHLKAARELFSQFEDNRKKIARPFDELKQTPPRLMPKLVSIPQFIFVTGMPRSGTTLTDQILDCHSDIHSIGESGIIAQLAYSVEQKTKRSYYKGVEQLSVDEKSNLVQEVLKERQLTTQEIILDTTPNNVFYVSFILNLIPNSKIIFCKRSPLDTCTSIYQYPLAQQSYANQLEQLGNFYLQTTQLIEHWEKSYSDSTTSFIYEHVTKSPEKHIKKLLHWLGLTFETSCLNPQGNKRHVLTPSSEQVRKPINQKAIGKWKHFSPYIGELTTILQSHENIYQEKLKDNS